MHQIRTMGPLSQHSHFRNGNTGLILELLASLPFDTAKRRQELVHRARREANLNSKNGTSLYLRWYYCIRNNLVALTA